MEKAKALFHKLIYPPGWILCTVAPVSFAVLIFVFVSGKTESTLSYMTYFMSAYSLFLWAVAFPRIIKKAKFKISGSRAFRKISDSKLYDRYIHDIYFRSFISLCQGMAVNILYTVFRIVAGIRYSSVWFVSAAVYYLILGGLRMYLLFSYRKKDSLHEYLCYRRTAWFLFLLNLPMGGMIILMIRSDPGISYPGYVIYLSAMYCFYSVIRSVVNVVRFRKLGRPVFSAAKVLDLISGMMSVLFLQTAMISRFSEGDEDFRKLMNTVVGGIVYGLVIMIAFYMILKSSGLKKEGRPDE